MKKTLTGLAILIALVGLSGCQRSIEPKAQAQNVAISTPCATDSDCEKAEAKATPRQVYYCAGVTKEGSRCRKHVKHEGDYCWMHQSQKN